MGGPQGRAHHRWVRCSLAAVGRRDQSEGHDNGPPPKGRGSKSRENADPPDGDGSGDSSSESDSSDSEDKPHRNYDDDDSYDSTSSSSSSEKDTSDSGPDNRRRSKSRSRRKSRGRSPSRTRYKEADACSLPEGFPTIAQLPRWKAQLLACVCQCANRADEEPVRKWLLKVERPKMTFKKLEKCPKEFTRLDRKLGTALGKILKGELARRVDVEEQRALRERNMLLSGRQKLFMMYDSFRTDESMARCYTIHDLCSVKWLGDNQLEALRNTWEDKVANQRESQSDDQLATILFEVLKHSKEGMLKDDVIRYRRWPYGHKKKTYKFLIRALDRQIDMNIRDKNFAALQGKSTAAPAPNRKKICKAFLRGECKNKECPFRHPKNDKGSSAPSAAVPTTAGGDRGRSQSRDKGKGKGKGKGQSRDRSTSPTHDKDGKQRPCKFWASGKCERENCGYSHAPADKGKKASGSGSSPKSGDRKRSSSRQSKTLCRNFAAGSCSYGDKCLFAHDHAASSKPAAKAAAKAVAKAAVSKTMS